VEDVAWRKVVVEWMDEWGWRVGTLRGVKTRRDMRVGVEERVFYVGFYVGGVEVVEKVLDWVVGLDHRPVEMVLEVIKWKVNKEEETREKVDWVRLEASLRGREEEGRRLWRKVRRRRKDLEDMVEDWERLLWKEVEENKGSRKWRTGRKKWWKEEVEEEYRRYREVEERYFGRKGEEERLMVRETRKEYKEVVERVKKNHWVEYLENLGLNKGYQWVKTDRDVVVDIPAIMEKDGQMVEVMRGRGG